MTNLAYDDRGSGEPVVFIAGQGGPGRTWLPHQVPAFLQAGYRVITFDNRGIGATGSAEGFTTQTMVADTAALIENLDLVVSVDTAIVHLAGALAVPTLLMLPFAADFRWLRERTDSPWYPNAELFRQPRFADWQPVIEEVRGHLALVLATRRPSLSHPAPKRARPPAGELPEAAP